MGIVYRLFHPSSRGKLRWTVVVITLLFLVSCGYSASELYSQNRDGLNNSLHQVPFLKSVNLPEIKWGTWPPSTFRLGLDLRGGTHLVYDADVSKTPAGEQGAALEGVRDVIERRVNTFGVAEPLVQTIKSGDTYRVVVELAGIKDVNQAIKMIGDTPLLEFKEEGDGTLAPQTLTDAQKKELDTSNAAADKKTAEALKKSLEPNANFAELVKTYSEDEKTRDSGGNIGWVSKFSPQAPMLPAALKLKAGEVAKNPVPLVDGGNNVIKLLGTRSAEKEIHASHILICFEGATGCDSKLSKDDAKKKIEELKKQANPQNFADLAKKNSTEPGAAEKGGDLGWFGKGALVKAFQDEVFAQQVGTISNVVETQFGFHIIWKQEERPLPEYEIARILIIKKTPQDILPPPSPWKDTALTGKQLKHASVQFSSNSQLPEVNLEFNEEGTKLFGEITARNVGKPVAIFLDGEPISTPRVQQPILDGQAVIQGDFTAPEAKLLAQRLNAGALPVPITLVSQQTVGASLGQESLEKSLMAGLIGFFLVAIFMIGFYRLPGVLAVIALLIYTSLVLAIFKVLPVTLTLSGIAGFILSVGMAVDANILIFERMKEELRWGKSLDNALRDGFKRAWTSIRDSNIASLITCTILFFFSASLIKGFALTLAIGILVSMFSAIFITKMMLQLTTGWKLSRHTWLFASGLNKKNEEKAA